MLTAFSSRFFTGLLAFVVLGVAVAPKTKSSQIFGLAIGNRVGQCTTLHMQGLHESQIQDVSCVNP